MTQQKGLKRNTVDKYYTKNETVEFCMNYILKFLNIKDQLIIEPSAGNGAFINAIKKITNNSKFFDIEPEHPEVITQDFLKVDHELFNNANIIGNPPFGRQSTTAIKFIKKSCEFAKSISFILPKSFKKENQQQHFGCYFHCIHEWGEVPDNCVFQIWIRKEYPRTKSD